MGLFSSGRILLFFTIFGLFTFLTALGFQFAELQYFFNCFQKSFIFNYERMNLKNGFLNQIKFFHVLRLLNITNQISSNFFKIVVLRRAALSRTFSRMYRVQHKSTRCRLYTVVCQCFVGLANRLFILKKRSTTYLYRYTADTFFCDKKPVQIDRKKEMV